MTKQIPGFDLSFVGKEREKGALPAFFYFSLSAEESLTLHPYNTPVTYFEGSDVRVFAFTLPDHGNDPQDKFQAMSKWAERIKRGERFLEAFLDRCVSQIDGLISQGLIDPQRIVTGGLSRGAWIATHLAAREKRISHVLGFAPLTTLSTVREFEGISSLQTHDLSPLIPELLHLKGLRFYIGNHDTKVDTDACYNFIRELSQTVYNQRIKNFSVELRITPAIGHKGHGTAPETFEEGALWLKSKI